MIQCWRLQDARQSLVLAATDDRLAEVVYWGAPLPEDEDLDTLARAHVLDLTGGMLDSLPPLSICPEATRSFPGQPGVVLRHRDRAPLLSRLALRNRRRVRASADAALS